ncbi:MAG: DUF2029 domain-containing protein [Chloroflexi bacterium]|nr:DUF2029 domain-containing protein [Chloroflexota bacterium]
MTSSKRLILLGAFVVLAALVVVTTVATHNVLTEPHPGHNDFMSRWEGARSFWRNGLNPYGDEASLNIQERIYGRASTDDEDPGYFAYPFYTVFLVWPVVYTTYAWASAIWMVALEVCLIAALILLLDLLRWQPKPWLLVVLLLWTLLNYYAGRGLILGQPGIIVYALQALALWALAKNREWLAGSALALSTIKPQMGFLLVPLLLLWSARVQRWPFVGAFVGTWGGLMLLSFALEPTWFGDWIEQVQRYPSYTEIGAPVWDVTQHYLGLGVVGEWTVNLALYALMLWAWYGVLVRQQHERLVWTVVLTLTITHMSAVRTATPHYVVFTIPLLFYLRWLAQRRRGHLWIMVILLVLLVLPWAHFLVTVEGEFEHPTLYLPVPFTLLPLLWFTRQQWWDKPFFSLPTPAEVREGSYAAQSSTR